MKTYGQPPFLECSSLGDKRFSAWYALIDGHPIDEIYHASKIFEDNTTNLDWKSCKQKQKAGLKIVNREYTIELYESLWIKYLEEHPEYIEDLIAATGLSDTFATGYVNQARVLWEIRNTTISKRSMNEFFEND